MCEAPEQEQKDTHAWQTDYDSAIKNFFTQQKPRLAEFIEIIFIQGTLNRMAPEDLEIRDLRLQKGSQTWEGTREDAELYWRIIYAIESSKHAMSQNWSISGSDYSLNVINAVMRLLYHPKSAELCEQLFPGYKNDTNKIFAIVMQKFQERALEELKKRDLSYPDLANLLQTNARGNFHGMPAYIERISFDGSFWLKPTDKENGHVHWGEIGKLTNYRGATPLQMHSKNFTLNK